jgi:hypothetical protein
LGTAVRLTRVGALAGMAKFSPDGKKILYSSQTNQGGGSALHLIEASSREKLAEYSYSGLRLYSFSNSGLLFLDSKQQLLLAPQPGSAARIIGQNICTARWDRKGNDAQMLLVREDEKQQAVLEYPQGKVLASYPLNLGDPFYFAMPSRDGRWVAFGRPSGNSVDYDLWILDTKTLSARLLVPDWYELGPIAFAASGDVVVGGIRRGSEAAIYRVNPVTGRINTVRVFSHMTIVEDIRDDDSMLVREIVKSREVFARLPGQASEAKLQLGGEFTAAAISPDGTKLVLTAFSPSDSVNQDLYLYDTVNSAKLTPLGLGTTAAISPDNKKMLTARMINGRGRAIEVDLTSLNERDISLSPHSYKTLLWSKANDGAFVFREGGTDQHLFLQDPTKPVCKRIDTTRAVPLTRNLIAFQKGEDLAMLNLAIERESIVGKNTLSGLILAPYAIPPNLLIGLELNNTRRTYIVDAVTGARRAWKHLSARAEGRLVGPVGVFSSDGAFYAYTVESDNRSLFFLPKGRNQ